MEVLKALKLKKDVRMKAPKFKHFIAVLTYCTASDTPWVKVREIRLISFLGVVLFCS